jgi:DNA-binding CsgD family transcriptional regulator
MQADLVAVLEAAYRLDGDERAWLQGLLTAVRPRFDHPSGVFAYTYDIASPELVRTIVGIGPRVDSLIEVNLELTRLTPRAMRRTVVVDGHPFGAVTETFGGALPPMLAPCFAAHGVSDALALLTPNPSGRGVSICCPLKDGAKPGRADRAVWTRVATHVGAAFRLREHRTGHDAVLSPNGRVEHAEEPAKSRDARDALSAMAHAIDRARGRLRRSDPEEAVAIWRALTAGRWSLVDHFDHDGRRYLIARPNEPEPRKWRTLTGRERAAVAFAAMGHTNKLIAYELGLAPSTVAMQLSRAARKVGARSRVELIAAYKRGVTE